MITRGFKESMVGKSKLFLVDDMTLSGKERIVSVLKKIISHDSTRNVTVNNSICIQVSIVMIRDDFCKEQK